MRRVAKAAKPISGSVVDGLKIQETRICTPSPDASAGLLKSARGLLRSLGLSKGRLESRASPPTAVGELTNSVWR